MGALLPSVSLLIEWDPPNSGKSHQTYLCHYGNKQGALTSNAKFNLVSGHGPELCPVN